MVLLLYLTGIYLSQFLSINSLICEEKNNKAKHSDTEFLDNNSSFQANI